MAYVITVEGYTKLQNELDTLKRNRRVIAERIDEARGHGDLKENAEYHAAKEEQGLSEARISQIEDKLSNVQVVDVNTLPKDCVIFGTTVKIENLDTEEVSTYQIVSDEEVEVKNGKISINSPIARAMLRKTVGDSFVVRAPGGEKEFEILEIV